MSRPGSIAVLLGCACALVLLGAPGEAHDIPDARVDRSIQATLRPARLEVDYEVSLSEFTLLQDLRALLGSVPARERSDLYDLYGRETDPLNARGLLAEVDRQPLEFRSAGFDLAVEEHPRFTFHLVADLPASGHLSLRDTNYVSSEGMSRLAVRADGVVVKGYDGPTDVSLVAFRPAWQLSDQEEKNTKEFTLDYRSKSAPDHVAPVPSVARGPVPRTQKKAIGLSRLLDTDSGSSRLGLLLLAGLLGAAHAIQPGHGKTLVAAASLDRHFGRGLFLGIVTTGTHVASVLVLAAVLAWTHTTRFAAIHRGIAGGAGFVVACVGFWRLGRSLGGHGHEHAAGAADPEHRSLLGLGLAGGVVPCWDGILLILLAAALGRLAFGVVLLGAFSAGMAAVLIAVGMLAARLRTLVTDDAGEGPWARLLERISSLLLAGIGLAMLLGGAPG